MQAQFNILKGRFLENVIQGGDWGQILIVAFNLAVKPK